MHSARGTGASPSVSSAELRSVPERAETFPGTNRALATQYVQEVIHDESAWAQDSARVTFKVGPGLAAFLAALDKFFRSVSNWRGDRSPPARRLFPVRPRLCIHLPH